jgi:hypothetical protein
MSDDLVKRLTIKAGVMEMGEKIAWGSDTSLMREAADRIEELEAQRTRTYQALLRVTKIHDEAEAKLAKALEALEQVQAFFRDLEPYADQGHTLVPALREACETLKEIRGETDD